MGKVRNPNNNPASSWNVRNPEKRKTIKTKSDKKRYISAKAERKANRHIIGWDSEGITTADNKHIMIYLANSEGDSISNANGISTIDALEFLLSCSEKNPKALNVWYSGSYDVNMILKDLPKDRVKAIWTNSTRYGVECGPYRIMYKPNRELFIMKRSFKEYVFDNKTGKRVPKVLGKIRIWDSIGYSQSSFLKAMGDWIPESEEYKTIQAGKDKRGLFTVDDLETYIPEYTAAELRALVKIESKMYAALDFAEIDMIRHDGAGSIASALLKKYGVKRHIPSVKNENELPPHIEKASQHAYFGGRIECMQFGHSTETIYHYDINSAYPAAMLNLPSLREGEWTEISEHKPDTFSIYHVTWESDLALPFYPLPYRLPQGQVRFPSSGECWVWEPELAAALNTPGMNVEIIRGALWETYSTEQPFYFIQELYDYRKVLKRDRNAAQIVIKLGINSVYGKLAQRIGYNAETGAAPPYHCMPWAGYITSKTRATLYNAGRQKPGSILFFATDGIFSTEPLDLPVNGLLGGWDYAEHDEMISIMSGVYMYRTGTEWTIHNRGLGGKSLVLKPRLEFEIGDPIKSGDWEAFTPECVLNHWKNGTHEIMLRSNRFLGMGAALASKTLWSDWGNWIDMYKAVKLHPVNPQGKRGIRKMYGRGKINNPAYGLLKTDVNSNMLEGIMSEPTKIPWANIYNIKLMEQNEIY
jgi:hypothetical protein